MSVVELRTTALRLVGRALMTASMGPSLTLLNATETTVYSASYYQGTSKDCTDLLYTH